MDQPDEDRADGETAVCGEEQQAGGGGGPVPNCDGVDGRVEEDGPAGGHEAQGGEAGAEIPARFEDGEGEDWG